MSLNHDNYIFRSLSKTRHKPHEHYVVNRIFHCLDDPEIEFVCQQLVHRKNEKRALTDMYFPQFGLHLEVNERHHIKQEEEDALRLRDIFDATGHVSKTIWTCDEKDSQTTNRSRASIDAQIDSFIELLNLKKLNAIAGSEFLPWDFEGKYNPQTHINRGYIDAQEDVAFRFQRDALRCFGYMGGHYQQGIWPLPKNVCRRVWLTRLGDYKFGRNSLADDWSEISDTSNRGMTPSKSFLPTPENSERIVFSNWSDPLGQRLYRFIGVFKIHSETQDLSVWRRIGKKCQLPNGSPIS